MQAKASPQQTMDQYDVITPLIDYSLWAAHGKPFTRLDGNTLSILQLPLKAKTLGGKDDIGDV